MIDNIFTALVREKTSGAILEFTLWCTACFAALMSLIALAMGEGQVTWILMMLFSIGFAVIMIFRLKEIALLYGAGAFYLIIFLAHYLSFGLWIGVDGAAEASHSPFNIILFVLGILLALAVVICAFVQFFSAVSLGTVLAILVLCDSCIMLLLQILMYTSEFVGDDAVGNPYHREWMNDKGYWIGTVGFWILVAVVAVFYACYFWGPIDKRSGKIYIAGGVSRSRAPAGLVGITGTYAGRTIYLQGRSLVVGSGEMAQIRVPDTYVSRMHCTVRFNMSTGFYEVLDQSSNGVWLSDGAKLQSNVYNSVQRGSVICIGSTAQQFRLI